MTRNKLNDEYFEWMCNLVYDSKYLKHLSYIKLLKFLDSVDFTYLFEMDGNRFEDGIDLRYRFGYERDYPRPVIATYIDIRSCSVLEMMIALSVRLEEHIMDNPDIGNRTGQWFWNMIANLGLGSMNDSKFDVDYAADIIHKFLNRDYERNGKGGLFTVEHTNRDLRDVEIWYQACWYLDEVE